MTKHLTQLTSGALFWTIFFAAVPAVLAAIFGFVGAIFLCGWLFRAELGQWDVFLEPAAAVLFGSVAFAITFRWIEHCRD